MNIQSVEETCAWQHEHVLKVGKTLNGVYAWVDGVVTTQWIEQIVLCVHALSGGDAQALPRQMDATRPSGTCEPVVLDGEETPPSETGAVAPLLGVTKS